jgi:hypothetical protein
MKQMTSVAAYVRVIAIKQFLFNAIDISRCMDNNIRRTNEALFCGKIYVLFNTWNIIHRRTKNDIT